MNLKIYETEISINPEAKGTFDFYPLSKSQLEDLHKYYQASTNSADMVLNIMIDKRTDLLMYFAVLGGNYAVDVAKRRIVAQKLKEGKRFKDA